MTAFNGTVMAELYIDVSEMSIVGPPPRTPGGRFFLLKRKRARHDELGEGFGWPGPRVYGLVNPKVYEVVSSLKILGEIARLGGCSLVIQCRSETGRSPYVRFS